MISEFGNNVTITTSGKMAEKTASKVGVPLLKDQISKKLSELKVKNVLISSFLFVMFV